MTTLARDFRLIVNVLYDLSIRSSAQVFEARSFCTVANNGRVTIHRYKERLQRSTTLCALREDACDEGHDRGAQFIRS